MRVIVVGASGFIGSHVVRAMRDPGAEVVGLIAPRIRCQAQDAREVMQALAGQRHLADSLVSSFRGADAVVNAAGLAAASSRETDLLMGANALLPAVILEAARRADVGRVLHVSSAGVQGRRPCLDETANLEPINLYTKSKAVAEEILRVDERVIIFRPTSVQGHGRTVTQALVKLLSSRFASVAGQGDRATPQVLVDNVADAVAFTLRAPHPPRIVLQPWEGLTTAGLVRTLGGREPVHVAPLIASVIIRGAYGASALSVVPPAVARRLEMLWYGQDQQPGWLTVSGWAAPRGPDAWQRLGDQMRARGDH